jgi:broad specificity phosphatase PhoE
MKSADGPLAERAPVRTHVAPALAPRLRRLLLVRAGSTSAHEAGRWVGSLDPPLCAVGRAQLRARRRHWEWADGVVASPLQRAYQSATLLVGHHAVPLDTGLRARDYGSWQGLRIDEIRARDPIAFADWQAEDESSGIPGAEPLLAFRGRVSEAIGRIARTGAVSLLAVTHGDVIREIVLALTGGRLPADRPRPGELVLLTRTGEAPFRLGRESSDPPPLRSCLERTGLSGSGPWLPERHIGTLELSPPEDAR